MKLNLTVSLCLAKIQKIEGTVNVGEMNLSGAFTGDVVAKRNVTIHRDGVLKGKVQCPSLVVEDGGILDGTIQMLRNNEPEVQ